MAVVLSGIRVLTYSDVLSSILLINKHSQISHTPNA